MFGHKYFLDTDLLYKRIKITRKQRFSRYLLIFLVSIVVSYSYNLIYIKTKGSIKEKTLIDNINKLKYNYLVLNKKFNNSLYILEYYQSSDKFYRTVLTMDTIPNSFLNLGYGGTKKYEELEYYDNSKLMINSLEQLHLIKNKVLIQSESFRSIQEQTKEWIRELEYLPLISPVNIIIKRGDGIKFREKHPILGTPAWHHGQDFSAPYGTEVYATGAGKIKITGWDRGLGNFIIIEHGYGYETIYGHLSSINIKKESKVKRGDLIGLTGSTGYSTGPHLHYQINLYGKYQNPLYFFNDDLTEDEYYEMIEMLNSQFKIR